MDNLLERFLRKIGIPDLTPFEGGSFSDLKNEPESNAIKATILLPHYLDYSTYSVFFDTINTFVSRGGFGIKLDFAYKDEACYFPRLLEEFKDAEKTSLMNDVLFFDGEMKIIFYYQSEASLKDLSDETRKLRDFLDSVSSSYKILTQERVYLGNDFAKKREESYKAVAEKSYSSYKKAEEINTHYQPVKLRDISNFRMVTVTGRIFHVEDRKTRKNTTIRTIEYSDGSDSIYSTLFEGKRMTMEEMDKYSVGTYIEVNGKPEEDQWNHGELTLRIDNIKTIDPPKDREDTYPRKRVELHLHTNMSSFDGVCTIERYIQTAKRWGHKAIAVTDHGVCQAFPDAQAAAGDMKILFGTEFYCVDDTPSSMHYIYNPSDRKLDKATYVVFDTETTGLSCRYDRLIEFGAVRIDSTGQILDTIDFFINPDMPLSRFSIEKSHISQEEVDHGKSIKKALADILEFFKDDILVAHNAAFDYGFINEALKNNNMPLIKNPVIDTLPLSRYLYPDMRSHREEALARRLDVEFDSTVAHRANYDASKLASIYEAMLSQLVQKNPDLKHKDLALLPVSEQMILSLHPFHLTAYAKNPDGLKDLYRIISESNTKHITSNGTPLVTRSYLSQYRKNLIIGSGCLNGEVWEAAITKSKDELIQKMSFYDFIEVQPPQNYIYQIHTGELHSEEEIKRCLLDLIHTAKDDGKIVCATGDCHYLNPEDKIYRDIMISAKGIKGVRHPLNLAPYDSAPEEKKQAWYKNPLPAPDQHFRTTDEMMECFSFLGDKALEEEIVIDNTNKIADAISGDIRPTKDGLYPPSIPGSDKMLSDLAYQTAKEWYGDPLPKIISDRLEQELDGIIKNGYSVIYWLSSDIVRWSNSCGYMIGSRGSVGSSFVATMTGITEVNPLPPHYRCPKCHHLEWADLNQYESGFDLPAKKCPECGTEMICDGQNIPFATFLGFHAEKVPDIDLNFPSDFQSTAHEHMKEVLNKTGNTCYKAGTIQTIQDKQARGYVLGYYESIGVETAKIRSAQLDCLGAGILDVKRSTGQHPGGVIVIPKGYEAFDFTPIQYPADDPNSTWMTTHYDFHKIHDNVLKFDMLGHVDPQAIRMQCDFCGFSFLDMKEKIPISDPEAHSLFWSADALHLKNNVLKQETGALGLPEFGTENGRRVLLETQPRSFADLVRISGLSHGTNVFAGNAEDLITKNGFKLKDVIACRDDIMTVLHEKYGVDNSDAFAIMEFTRKGRFGKPGSDDKKAKFDKVMQDHKVPDWYIESCHKIAYMFPKGHAVAYVSNCIRCAWFKVHEPLSYYATYFTLRCDAYDIKNMVKGINACLNKRNDILNRLQNHEKVSNTEQATINAYESTIEMYDRGYKFENLSVEKSEAGMFTIDEKNQAIIPPFSAIDGLGESAGQAIVKARKEHPFTSIEDLQERGHVSDKLVEVLRDLGALGDLPDSEQMTLF